MFWEDQYIEDVYGALGDNVTLECLVAADPKTTTFNWTHTGLNGTTYLEPVVGDEAGFEQYISYITIEHLDRESYGNATCTVANEVGIGEPMVFHIQENGRIYTNQILT